MIWPACLAAVLTAGSAQATDALLWRTQQDKVDAQFDNWSLIKLLKKVSAVTGWKVFVEPGANYVASAKFNNLSEDQALRRLLGNLNYSRASTNGATELYVYRTIARAATELVPAPPAAKKDYRIANEWIVKLKKGSNLSADELAKSVGAKVVGRDDKLNLYRLQFADATAATTALDALQNNPAVGSVDSNYSVDRPAPAQMTSLSGAGAPPFTLNPAAPVDGPIVGLVDTAVQMQDQFKQYTMTPLSVVGPADPSDDQPTHGTMMLETVLAAMANAPSKILPVDVYGSGESTTTYDVVEGIVAAVNAGANPINLSLGGTGDSSLLESLIQEASQKGVQFVAASGNNGGTADTYPAAYPGVLSVTASAPNGQVASYADDGPWVKVIAPGTAPAILNGQEWIVDGTSVSTATVTGTITQLENSQHLSLSQAVDAVMKMSPAPKP
jgi:hypothetical protein